MFGIFGKPDLNKLNMNRDIPGLIKVIHKSDPETKKEAAKTVLAVMSQLGDDEVLSTLTKNFSNEELVGLWFENWKADIAIGHGKLAILYRKIGMPIVDLLLLKLDDPKIQERVSVYGDLITLLGSLKDLRVLRPILNICMTNPQVRGNGGYSIANLYVADRNGFMTFYNDCSDVEKGAMEISIWMVDKEFGNKHVDIYKAAAGLK